MRILPLLMCCVLPSVVFADEQVIAPGTGRQSTVVVSTGVNGLCETDAVSGDIQSAALGSATPNRNEIKCGTNKLVDTAAAGDDIQLVAVGSSCSSVNKIIIDTGEDGIPNTPLAGDDTYNTGIVFGVAPANSACVSAGADGVAQTSILGGDDVRVTAAGSATPNTDVVRCGPNGIVDTTANNVTAGDDVQLIPLGGACTAGQVVINSGLNGIASTQAEGPDLLIGTVRPVKVTISSGNAVGTKTVKFLVSNVETSTTAPVSRAYRLTATAGTCPGGTVSRLDADVVTPGLQATASIPRGGRLTATATVTMKLEAVTSANRSAPYRCTFDVSAVALDTAPEVDDAVNPENNTVQVDLEVIDRNDL